MATEMMRVRLIRTYLHEQIDDAPEATGALHFRRGVVTTITKAQWAWVKTVHPDLWASCAVVAKPRGRPVAAASTGAGGYPAPVASKAACRTSGTSKAEVAPRRRRRARAKPKPPSDE